MATITLTVSEYQNFRELVKSGYDAIIQNGSVLVTCSKQIFMDYGYL